MLIYLLFFYLFRNTPYTAVDASPILKLASNSTPPFPESIISLATRQSDSSTIGACNCNQRSTLDIVWSCIATLFLCTWSSIHPNMPAPKDEWWRILWRRLKSMYWALIAPELVLTWAMKQWIGAGNILKVYEELPDQPKWTKKHAHFLQMGGFHLREPGRIGSRVLKPSEFYMLLLINQISVQSINERDIEDKSKADALTKIVLIFQTLWFVIQCIGRHVQGLALVQLEVATLAVISCTFILCVIWWDKPFDAQQPIYLDRLLQPESPPTIPPDEKNISQDVLVAGDMEPPSPHPDHIENPGISNHLHVELSPSLATPPDKPDVCKNGDDKNSVFQTDVSVEQLDSMPMATLAEGNDIGESDGPARDMENPGAHPDREDSISNHLLSNRSETPDSPPDAENTAEKKIFLQTVVSSICSFCITILSIPLKAIYQTVSSIYQVILKEVMSAGSGGLLSHFLVICISWPIFNPIYDLIAGDDSKQERVGSYYSCHYIALFKIIFLPALSAGLFGLVHCILWESEFPSATERVLWRISAIGVGSLLAVSGFFLKIRVETSNYHLRALAGFGILMVFSAYILARYYLLIEALLSLRALHPSAFQTIEWSHFLPHM